MKQFAGNKLPKEAIYNWFFAKLSVLYTGSFLDFEFPFLCLKDHCEKMAEGQGLDWKILKTQTMSKEKLWQVSDSLENYR